jgi:hypothetical protein
VQPQYNSSFQSPAPSRVAPDGSDIDSQLAVSRSEYERVRQEKIELERHEVKVSDKMSAARRVQIVGEKRKYVLMLDTIRKRIKDLETIKHNGGACAPSASISNCNGNGSNTSDGRKGVSTYPTPIYGMGGIDGAIGTTVPSQPWLLQGAGPGTFPAAGFTAGGIPWNSFQPAPAAAAAVDPPRVDQQQAQQETEHAIESPTSEPSPSSRAQPRRSHAVQIRAPIDFQVNAQRGSLSANDGEHIPNLNPTSPGYEPGKPCPLTEGSPPHFVVPALTPIETPNGPPAELAKHWVFSQQQAHTHNTHTTHTHTHDYLRSQHTHMQTLRHEHEHAHLQSQHEQEQGQYSMNETEPTREQDERIIAASLAPNGHHGLNEHGLVIVSIAFAVPCVKAQPGSRSPNRSRVSKQASQLARTPSRLRPHQTWTTYPDGTLHSK